MINYNTYVLGELQTNCYIVWDDESKDGVIIDPADEAVFVSEEILRLQINPVIVLATHGHFDHVLAALDLKLMFNIPFGCSQKDFFLLDRQSKTATHFLKKKISIPDIKKIDIDLQAENEIAVGKEIFKIIKTPGHTPGGVCFYNKSNNLLFSGDTLFAGTRGRTDLSYSSTREICKSLGTLMELPEETVVLPGHGEETTIGREKSKYVKG